MSLIDHPISQASLHISPIITEEVKDYNSVHCRVRGNFFSLVLAPYGEFYLSSDNFCLDTSLLQDFIHVEFQIFYCFISVLVDDLCCAWLIYSILVLVRYRCPEIGTSSVDSAQLNRFYLKTETEFSLRSVVFRNINKTVF
jgi:hypothetical protein